MRIRGVTWRALAAAAMMTSPVAGQVALPDSAARRIDAVFSRYTAETPGCAVGVFANGRIVFEKGYGLANIEYGVPFSPTTPTIMGSVSKQFTAAAIVLLAEQGRLSLDDDVRKYVPELPDYGHRVTIAELVHHTSGIRDFWALVDAAGMRFDDGYTVGDVIALAARQRHLNFDPGTEYNYSNTGYVLLGAIVQRVTGMSLRQFEQEQIFAPLGMRHSEFHDDHNEPVRGRAFAYSPAGAGWRINVWNNDIVGQGGLMTTVEDLQKWDENFYTGRVGGPTFLAQQLERGRLANGTQIAYAFGLEIGEYRGLPSVEHAGSTGGYRTAITRFPGEHTTVVTLCNVSSADATDMAHRVADIVLAGRFTKSVSVPTRSATARQAGAAVSLPPAEIALVAGTYYSEELDATYQLVASGGTLMVRRPRSAQLDTLRATDDTTFRTAGYTLRFAAPTSGGARTFTIDNGRVRGVEFRRRQ